MANEQTSDSAATTPAAGQVITPGSQPSQAPEAPAPTEQPATQQAPQADDSAPAPFVDDAPAQPELSSDTISWTASEFIAHHKSSGWYLGLVVGALVLAAVIYLLTRDAISTAVVLVGAVIFGVYAGRKPRELQYKADAHGLTIDQKYYPYEGFRSFAVIDEGAFASIAFMPLRRFAPLVSIYFAPDDEDKIIKLLADHLPFEEHPSDPIDNLMRRIRF